VFRQADKRRALAKEVVCGLGSTVADSTLCNEVFLHRNWGNGVVGNTMDAKNGKWVWRLSDT
jgi:hypothetical protein